MATITIGKVKGGKSKRSFDVRWNESFKDVYVSYAGGGMPESCGLAKY